MKKSIIFILFVSFVVSMSCTSKKEEPVSKMKEKEHKIVVYQVFTRLFGNDNTTNKPWGTIEENGVGKFNDFSDKALQEIKNLGVTHIWYTGVPHHATITDYTKYGISNDDPDVVKGRAGSPYAVKDYYNVSPDLAVDPAKRLVEFEALIDRSHKNGLKVIIDIVPNHVARRYEGKSNPEGVRDFGADDDTTKEYDKDNNFYYVVGEEFKVPVWKNNYLPLGGEKDAAADGKFKEVPAKWTGNGSRLAQPDFYDWYETVKINYGVRPDGTKDFEELPEGFDTKTVEEHFDFWKDKTVPSSWKKFRDIALYWTEKGVDGFRYDMAEMVPVEFWSYMNSSIKMKNSDAFLLAEVYNPAQYRSYICQGKMDYLYDKVALYDTIKHIMQGHGSTDHIAGIQHDLSDIEHNMLHFLENHDEQRIASPEFAGAAEIAKPAMVVSTLLSTAPTMVYFGQETGEAGAENAGFGSSSRTSIFDYVGVPSFQRWTNHKAFDGGQLTESEQNLRDFYKRLLNFTIASDALMGDYQEIHGFNRATSEFYNDRIFSFVRWSENEKLIIASNFSATETYGFDLNIPEDLVTKLNLKVGIYDVLDQLYDSYTSTLIIENGVGKIRVDLKPLESVILKIKKS